MITLIPLIYKITFLSVGNVYLWLNVYEVKYPLVPLEQSVLETGWYRCTNCSLKYNNIFGFYSDHYLTFDNWIESIEYYKRWQDKYMPSDVDSIEKYYKWLDDYGYASAKNYVKTLKQIKI